MFSKRDEREEEGRQEQIMLSCVRKGSSPHTQRSPEAQQQAGESQSPSPGKRAPDPAPARAVPSLSPMGQDEDTWHQESGILWTTLQAEEGCGLQVLGTYYGVQGGAFWNHKRLTGFLEEEPKVGRGGDQRHLGRNRYEKTER